MYVHLRHACGQKRVGDVLLRSHLVWALGTEFGFSDKALKW